MPVVDYPDLLPDPADFKAIIADCHEHQVFPLYHQRDSEVFAPGWYQDGYGFCWAYGLTAATMDCRAAEARRPVRLSPFSLGWLVGWRNEGYYCDLAIQGARERGIAPEEYVPQYELNPRRFKEGWEEAALNYRPIEWWDTLRADGVLRMIAQCLAILQKGRPPYVAYDWWGHALECCALRWDETEKYSVVWVLRNSHGEPEPIELAGDHGVPDEAYGVRATSVG